jgi:hypothetical protein
MSRLDRTVATMTELGAATPAKELVSLADTTFSTGLIERSVAAFASGMPEGAGDDGFFGPASVTWRMSADLTSPVAGLRSLLMQALHPLAMAGVDQHSGWRRDPVGRLAATMAYLTTVTFGDRAAALQRINLGLFAVLGELSATADWRAIAEEIWPFVQGPAATPMGEAEARWRARRQAMAA